MPTLLLYGPRLNAKNLIAHVGGSSLVIPKEGWTANSFAVHGASMISTMATVAKITERRALGGMAKTIKKFLDHQTAQVLLHFQVISAVPIKSATIELSFNDAKQEAIWFAAIDEALKEANIDAEIELTPPMQSVMAQGYSKVSVLLGNQAVSPDVNQGIARRAREAAQKITRINETTRETMRHSVQRSIKENLSTQETAGRFIKDMGNIASNRALTIARTELNSAWSNGAKQAFKECKGLTYVSVIGCESREEERWGQPSYQQFLYRGESTCNIQRVPVHDVDLLNFHPNHTGTIVPAGFI